MDLHLIPNAVATADERAAIDSVLGPPQAGRDGAGLVEPAGRNGRLTSSRRQFLLPVLQAITSQVGAITPGSLNYLCRRLDVPPAEAYGVASFYHLFSFSARPPAVAHVCDDLACRVNGALDLCRDLENRLGPEGGAWKRSPCLGQCERAPAVLIQRAGSEATDFPLAPATGEAVVAAVTNPAFAPTTEPATPGAPGADPSGNRLLRRVGQVNPESLDEYLAQGGYAALRQAFQMGRDAVVQEVIDSRLVGRGGAAFPTGRKWLDVARAPATPHYLVCNADESEPGTFKDRILMEEDPFALVEAMTIASFATGCEHGYIYVRGEYPLAAERLQHAIDLARQQDFLGENILGEPVTFDIEIRRGAGAYICGEETALFNSLEGRRGEPRNKPPFPTQAGLFGKPTVVNNVETLVNVLDIVLGGGAAYAAIGTAQSTGAKLFCVSGCVSRPGLYEAPFGITLRDLLARAGGMRAGRTLRAVLLGGAAGTFLTPAEIDVPLTFEDTRAIGVALGSGVVLALDDTVDLTDVVLRIAAFFRDESCGQCVPCRVGTQRQEEALHRLAAGRPLGSVNDEIALIDNLGLAMRDASICGLGQTASGAVQSAIQKLGLFGRGVAL